MSPEQVRGETVDTRTDVWAFGCLLYEMLSGQPAFRGASPAEVMAAVLRDDVDWDRLPPETPAPLRRLLRRCLRREAAGAAPGHRRCAPRAERAGTRGASAGGAGARTRWPALALALAGGRGRPGGAGRASGSAARASRPRSRRDAPQPGAARRARPRRRLRRALRGVARRLAPRGARHAGRDLAPVPARSLAAWRQRRSRAPKAPGSRSSPPTGASSPSSPSAS